jgi:uncharacterized protein YjbI with pentapeptide repeats
MISRRRSWWQKIPKFLLAGIVVLVVLIVMISIGYWFKWNWTGLNERIGPNVQQYQPAKTFWDWLNLLGVLAIPIAVALGTQWFTTKQNQQSDKENKDNQRETALQGYIDKMSELLLANHLQKLEADEGANEVREIARIRTLTVLRRLDSERRGNVLDFLHEAGLISKNKCIIDLTGANLSKADLPGANLSKTYLIGVNLAGANLSVADLHEADLRATNLSAANLSAANLANADLSSADLSEARLSFTRLSAANLSAANFSAANLANADLSRADLSGADLSKARLSFANLSGANLSGANLSKADLLGALVTTGQRETVSSLQGATMSDGLKHP